MHDDTGRTGIGSGTDRTGEQKDTEWKKIDTHSRTRGLNHCSNKVATEEGSDGVEDMRGKTH